MWIVRRWGGDGNILVELGQEIRMSAGEALRRNRLTCQLYAGHRGAGKSTELLRLAQFLKEHQFKVVYFAADEEDINAEDTQYIDILLACTLDAGFARDRPKPDRQVAARPDAIACRTAGQRNEV